MNNKSNIKKVQILGETWTIYYQTLEENKTFNRADGYCDRSTNKIYYRHFLKNDDVEIKNVLQVERKTLRHEIIHAFLIGSGLDTDSNGTGSGPWALNEEMVDWIAVQFPKIQKVYKQLGIEQ